MSQGCFGVPVGDCRRKATTLCGLCDGHFCKACIGPHYDEHDAPRLPAAPPTPTRHPQLESALRILLGLNCRVECSGETVVIRREPPEDGWVTARKIEEAMERRFR